MKKNTSKIKFKSIFRFSMIFLIVFLSASAVVFTIEKESQLLKAQEAKNTESAVVKLESDYISQELHSVISDLFYLKDAYETALTNQNEYERVSENWKQLSNNKRIYDQIRYIDVEGNEKIRVNYSLNGSYKPYVLS